MNKEKQQEINNRLNRRFAKIRKKHLNRQMKRLILAICIICIICIGSIAFNSYFAKASAPADASTVHKYYESIVIQSGDTLYSIAQSYMCDKYSSVDFLISELKHMNSLRNDRIDAGNYLVVPYYGTEL